MDQTRADEWFRWESSYLCQPQILWFGPHTARYWIQNFSRARVLFTHTDQKLNKCLAKGKCFISNIN